MLRLIVITASLLLMQACTTKTHELLSPCVAIEPTDAGAQSPCVRRPVNSIGLS